MVISRTARGTASSKNSGTTLTISDVTFVSQSMSVVILGYDDVAGHPTSVAWGNRLLRRKIARDASIDFSASIWIIPRVRNTRTRDLVATWASAIEERSMLATQLVGVNRVDEKAGNVEGGAGTADPVTSATDVLSRPGDFAIGAFISEGPGTDDAGTAEIKDEGEFVSASFGQREGTVGAPPRSNVTVQEIFLELTSVASTEARLRGATSRKWNAMLLVLRRSSAGSVGVTLSDVLDVSQLFQDHVPTLDPLDAMWDFNDDTDEWEVYDRADINIRIGRMTEAIGWVAE